MEEQDAMSNLEAQDHAKNLSKLSPIIQKTIGAPQAQLVPLHAQESDPKSL